MPDLILIVDDEKDLVETLAYNLRQSGFDTCCAYTGGEAVRMTRQSRPPDLVLLDLMLPDILGTDVCRMIRENPHTRELPVLMLTARGEASDRISGLEYGADDYVVKPFSVRELILRIEAILRRRSNAEEKSRTIALGALTIDLDARKAALDGEPLTLSSLEWRLLSFLLENRGRAHSRAELLNKVWDIQANVQTRTVDVHVKRLRDKLGEAGRCIRTVRGFGYRFDPDEAVH